MKKVLVFLLSIHCFIFANEEFIPHFQEIFKQIKVKTFLEFGMGPWTQCFLDASNKVISVEFVTPGYGPGNYVTQLGEYQKVANWIPLVYFSAYEGSTSFAPYKYLGSEALHRAAAYQCATHKDYSLIDDFYLTELGRFIGNLTRFHRIDIAFANSLGIYNRSDLIHLFFEKKIPIVAAVATNVRQEGNDVYGYCRLKIPEEYEEISIFAGGGAIFWILKQEKYQQLIENMKNYAKTL